MGKVAKYIDAKTQEMVDKLKKAKEENLLAIERCHTLIKKFQAEKLVDATDKIPIIEASQNNAIEKVKDLDRQIARLTKDLEAVDDTYRVNEDGQISKNVLENDKAVDAGDALFAELVSEPNHKGAFVLNPNGTFIYEPKKGFIGTDTFQYKAKDQSGVYSQVATATITVEHANHAPVAVDDQYSVKEDGKIPGNVLANDHDVDKGDKLSAVLVSAPTNHKGTFVLNSDGTFIYEPKTGFKGTDTFRYKAKDPSGAYSQDATATITVEHVNHAPVAVDDTYSVKEDGKIPGNVLANDHDIDAGDTLSAILVSAPANNKGTFVLNSDGTFIYEPKAKFYGTDTFQYKAKDKSGAYSPVATATITVDHVNHAPVAVDDKYSTARDSKLKKNVLSNDHDDAGDKLSAVLVSAAPVNHKGAFVLNSDGTFIYEPKTGFMGTDTFKYKAKDQSEVYSQEATVTIDVTKTWGDVIFPVLNLLDEAAGWGRTFLWVDTAWQAGEWWYNRPKKLLEPKTSTVQETPNPQPSIDSKDPNVKSTDLKAGGNVGKKAAAHQARAADKFDAVGHANALTNEQGVIAKMYNIDKNPYGWLLKFQVISKGNKDILKAAEKELTLIASQEFKAGTAAADTIANSIDAFVADRLGKVKQALEILLDDKQKLTELALQQKADALELAATGLAGANAAASAAVVTTEIKPPVLAIDVGKTLAKVAAYTATDMGLKYVLTPQCPKISDVGLKSTKSTMPVDHITTQEAFAGKEYPYPEFVSFAIAARAGLNLWTLYDVLYLHMYKDLQSHKFNKLAVEVGLTAVVGAAQISFMSWWYGETSQQCKDDKSANISSSVDSYTNVDDHLSSTNVPGGGHEAHH